MNSPSRIQSRGRIHHRRRRPSQKRNHPREPNHFPDDSTSLPKPKSPTYLVTSPNNRILNHDPKSLSEEKSKTQGILERQERRGVRAAAVPALAGHFGKGVKESGEGEDADEVGVPS